MTRDYRIDDLPPRIAAKIRITEAGCWEWTGARRPDGYGIVWWNGQKNARVHRVVYTLLVGPIPNELTLDHVAARGCRSRACCWPVHLEAVTSAVNTVRAVDGNAAKTHCPKNHPYDLVNTHWTPTGARICRACQRDHARRYRAADPELGRDRDRRRYSQDRNAVLDHYGRACRCCGSIERLTISQVDGTQNVPQGGRPRYRWLIANGFPEGFHTLCVPCHRSRATAEQCRLDHGSTS